jgi:hypothetical protein
MSIDGQGQGTLLGLLQSRQRSASAQRRALEEARAELGLDDSDELSPICVAYALIRLRVQPEEVSRLLSWREFEGLAGALIRASGYEVRENVYLKRPRAQIDLVAYGPSLVLCVDCKHYRREQGPSLLAKFALAQLERSSLLKRKTQDSRPIASVLLSMSEPEGRFVEGVAVVPIRTLRSFLNSVDSYLPLLALK